MPIWQFNFIYNDIMTLFYIREFL